MCFDCLEKTRNSFSKDSRERLDRYFGERVDFEKRLSELMEKCGMSTGRWLSRCLVKGTPKAKCSEYQIYGMFIDRDIVFTGFPYMLSGEVLDEVLDLLSAETSGVLDDLTSKLLGIDMPSGLVFI
jgi:hypothetical protein